MIVSIIDDSAKESPQTLADLGSGLYLVDLCSRRNGVSVEKDVLIAVCNGSYIGLCTNKQPEDPTDIRGWSSLPGAQISATICKIANVRKVDIKALSLAVTRKL